MSEEQVSSGNVVAVFLADGFEEVEALTVVDLLQRAGIPVTTVSVSDSLEVKGSHNIRVVADTVIRMIDPECFDMLVLPGGMPGTVKLGACKKLTAAVASFGRSGKEIAAICAAPTILADLGLVEGVPVTCYPGREKDMRGAILTHESAVTSGNIITGRGVGCAIPFALAIVEHYRGAAAAKDLSEKIVWNVGKDGKSL
jgi:4-methyl-5(b-hydroxyethyl)-thiazole monophosphate biosynthesis